MQNKIIEKCCNCGGSESYKYLTDTNGNKNPICYSCYGELLGGDDI